MSNRSPYDRCRLLLGLIALAAFAVTPLGARLRGFAAPSRLADTSTEAAQNPEFDLLIKGGQVIDPKNGVNAVVE